MLKIKTDLGCRLYIDEEYKGIAYANTINRFELKKGEYWARFESLTDSSTKIEKKIQINDWEILELANFRPLMHSYILLPFKDKDLWGYRELFSKVNIVEPIYSSAEEFINGYAIVSQKKLYGIIRDDGTEVLSCEYEKILRVWRRTFIIYLNNRISIFDPGVPESISFEYDDWDYVWNADERDGIIRSKENGLIILRQNNQIGVYDCLKDQWRLPCIYQRIGYPLVGGFRLAYKKDNECDILSEQWKFQGIISNVNVYSEISFAFEKDNIILVQKEGQWGGLDFDGGIVFPCVYDLIYSFCNGLFRVGQGSNGYYKFGFVNLQGELIIPCIYDWATDFANNIAFVQQGLGVYTRKGFFINNDGSILCEHKDRIFPDELYPLGNELVVGHNEQNCLDSLYNLKGEAIIPKRLVRLVCEDTLYFEKGLLLVWEPTYDDNGLRQGELYGLLGMDGEYIIKPKYTEVWIEHYCNNSQHFIMCERYGHRGILGRDGREIIPCIYDSLSCAFDENYHLVACWVTKNGRSALFDPITGKQYTQFLYSSYSPSFFNGMAFAINDDNVQVIDNAGNTVLSTLYTPIPSEKYPNEVEGYCGSSYLCCVSKEGKKGFFSLKTLSFFQCEENFDCAYYVDNLHVALFDRVQRKCVIIDAETGIKYLPEIDKNLSPDIENSVSRVLDVLRRENESYVDWIRHPFFDLD